MTIFRFTTVFVLALGFTLPASAQEPTLCPAIQPCTVSRPVTVGMETTLPLVWRGRGQFDRIDIASESGFFVLDDPTAEPLGVVQRPLVEQVTGSPDGGPVNFTFNETLTVPAEVSRTAAGARQLLYIRQFSVNGIPVTGVQSIRLSAPLPDAATSVREGQAVTASGLILRRVSLRFDDGAAAAAVGRNGQLRALAAIRYERAGLLEAAWEVATPATTRGQPVFRRLDTLRQYLGSGREGTLQSPLLPTGETGLYLLRLRLLQPSIEQDSIELRYRVSGEPAPPEYVPALRVDQPATGRPLGSATEFRWRPVAGTHAYQLELYDQLPSSAASPGPHTAPAEMATAPASGLLLEGSSDRTRLSPSVLHRLLPGRIYYWRIVAINAGGAVVAASPVQPIRTEE